ncbi:VOC family protein [Aliikangiella coralliicola]|uniref:VOC family protein n=1 Tax=Aliikangiella coralliicola TaxID=2592383 RepID=A0A545UHR5_9GAMM|nr:VOC family protein [Aliikangiella coralliicola]TQV89010.1 VOC family protein [Aliikangiella coralliicola]
MEKHHKINYIEFPVKNIPETKAFFAQVFEWQFVDYGDDYCAVSNAALDAGFFQSDQIMTTSNGSALIVIYSEQLEQTHQKILEANGQITKPIFSFPGGRRFHFSDLNGNEYAVWSDK